MTIHIQYAEHIRVGSPKKEYLFLYLCATYLATYKIAFDYLASHLMLNAFNRNICSAESLYVVILNIVRIKL